MVCRGLCDSQILLSKYEIRRGSNRQFIDGFRLCVNCERSFLTTETHCPCCGNQLRTSPRSNKLKQRDKYLEQMNIKRM